MIKPVIPAYPQAARIRGKEGWVEISMVVRPDGSVADPVVENSSGEPWFEKAALKALLATRYSPATVNGKAIEQCQAKVRYTFFLDDIRRRGAQPKFRTAYKIASDIAATERTADLKAQLDTMDAAGTWNLYESARLSILHAELARRNGDDTGRLRALEKAAAFKGRFLEPAVYRKVLAQIFALQVNLKLYASALATHGQMGMLKPPEQSTEIDAAVAQITAAIDGPNPIGFDGVVEYRTGCAEGRPNWQHQLLRRKFTFNDAGSKLTDFELRCDWKRVTGLVSTDKFWEIPKTWGWCQVFVFGDLGAKVKLVEYPTEPVPTTADSGAPSEH